MGIIAFLRILFRYLRPYWLQASILMLLLLVDIVFTTAWPLGFKFFIDYALEGRSQRMLVIILVSLLAGVLLSSLASLGRDYFYAFLNANETGSHTPGVSVELAQWLANDAPIIGFGVETVGTDAGAAHSFEPAFPCHSFLLGARKYGLTQLANLAKLPTTGAVLIATGIAYAFYVKPLLQNIRKESLARWNAARMGPTP